MKALTISQPFASLIASGEKWVENRKWATDYRGPLAIHAGKGTQYLDREEMTAYPTGCIIAIADLVACVGFIIVCLNNSIPEYRKQKIKNTNKTWSEVAWHAHTEGPWCWILENVRPIEHVAIAGKQNLWNWEPVK